MLLPRLPTAAVLTVLAGGLALGSGAAAGARPAPDARPFIVAVGAAAASVTRPDGTERSELPWLLPGDADPAVSPDGRRIAFSSERDGSSEVYVADAATGEIRRLTSNPGAEDRRPAWSPDGRRIAWQSGRRGAFDLFVMGADGDRKRRLVTGAGDDVDPAWSPDGLRIAFASSRAGRFDLWSVPASGGEPELLLDARGAAKAPAWSPDGERIAYSGTVAGTTRVWLLELAAAVTRPLSGGPGAALRPDWSPDGQFVAFTRASGGRAQTWIVDVQEGSRARPVGGTDGDTDPDWALATTALAPGAEQQLPDLDQRAPAGLMVIAAAGRFRLGFDSAVENLGRGPLRVRGTRPAGSPTMRADQVIELDGGGTRVVRGIGRLRYESHPPHRHWHFQPFERYELRRAADHALAGRDRKSGFCLIDRYGRASARVANVGPPRFVSDCGALRPGLRRVEEGSSAGYVDRYPAFFHGQDIDVTGLAAGTYLLVHRANPERLVRELRYTNNEASVRLRLTWPAGAAAPPRVAALRRCEASERCPAAPAGAGRQ